MFVSEVTSPGEQREMKGRKPPLCEMPEGSWLGAESLRSTSRDSRDSRADCWESVETAHSSAGTRYLHSRAFAEEEGHGAISCLQNMMTSHILKPDTRNCKRPRELEPQMPDSPQLSSLGKSDSSLLESSGLFYKDESLEKDLNDMSKEINLMLSAYAKILRQRAAVDASYIDELDGLFKEANTIENFLIQKRELLRQRFTVIANTLHR
ncbi:testis-expressed protein 12 isoform X5 [Mustela lutreola]|uniref:testis-expressed protein 12 isoform X5 n=1 Tax=Mustela lutreola TaxID=9666 RepID=UPI00279731DF|nr:testis-expressed protein 12 isoform X5 [Mustela lutreola]